MQQGYVVIETINHILSECSKLARKESKTGRDWVGKVIHLELCKQFKFNHTKQMVYTQPRIRPGECDVPTFVGF